MIIEKFAISITEIGVWDYWRRKEDGIDSSKEAGKLLISIIVAVAEMERENIRVQ